VCCAGWFLLAWPLGSLVRLHPYPAVYFNLLAGPRDSLHERYETDYWVLSYRGAAEWINARQRELGRRLRVAVAANQFSGPAFEYFAAQGVTMSYALGPLQQERWPEEIDFYVATTRYDQWKNFPSAPIVHRIEADGILLAVIRARP
jgi:hypothetical protein